MKKVLLLFILLVLPNFVFGQEINKILEERLKSEPAGSAISVAVVDEKGTKFYSVGNVSKLPNAKAIDKNTVFEIGSITKVFTGILLAEAIKRSEVKPDDPVSKYLPATIKPLKYNDKEITLLDLATHGSALPSLPDDFDSKDPLNPYADYTVEQMYAFLGRYKLTRKIGSKFEYSNLAVGLLGHILALQAKMSYEDLVKTRILKPLGMNDTAITFTPSMKSHLALGHDAEGKQTPNWDLPTFAGAGALRSTASDMVKFLAANLGIAKTKISDSLAGARKLRKTYDTPPFKIGFNWITTKSGEREIQWHNGGTGGYRSFAGLDKEQKKGVFIVTNGSASIDDIGFHILNSKVPLKKIEKAKTEITLSEEILEIYVGEYQLSPTFSIVVTREGGNVCCSGNAVQGGSFDQTKMEQRNDILVYSSDILKDGIELTGNIDITLYVSSDAKDTDFTVKLIDVDEQGRAYNLDETIQRMRYRDGYDKPLVWMEKDKVYKVKFQPMVTSNYFAPGHRIRLEISSSNFPRFDRNLNTGGNNYDETKGVVARNAVHHSKQYPAEVTISVIKKK